MQQNVSEEQLTQTAQLMRVQWRKAHNYWTALTKTYLDTKKVVDSGAWGTDPKTGLSWTMARFMAFRAGLAEEQVAKMLSIFHRVLAEEDKTELERVKAEKAKERRALAEQRKADNIAARAVKSTSNEAGSTLVPYDEMCRAIAATHDIDDVKTYIDKAAALKEYMRRAQNHDAERKCAEIRIRAEQRAGEIRIIMEKAKGAREPGTHRGTTRSTGATASKTLAELGITKDQSADWQKLASIPKDQFEGILVSLKMPSTAAVLQVAGLQTVPKKQKARRGKPATQRSEPNPDDILDDTAHEKAFAAVLPLVQQGLAISRDKLAGELDVGLNTVQRADYEARGYIRGINQVTLDQMRKTLEPHTHEYVCKYCGKPK